MGGPRGASYNAPMLPRLRAIFPVALLLAAGALAALSGARADGPPPPHPLRPPPADETDKAPPVPDAGGVVRLPSIRIDTRRKEIEIDGQVNLRNGVVEVFGCTEWGKVHESVLLLLCRPRHVKLGLILLDLKERPQVENLGDAGALEGDLVEVIVSWEEKGRRVEYRAEDLVLDHQSGATMDRVGFVFTGSRFQKVGPKEIFMADAAGQVLTTYHDPDAILDNPLAKGGDDTIYYANSKILPKAKTPCLVRMRPLRPGAEGTPGLPPSAVPGGVTPTGKPK